MKVFRLTKIFAIGAILLGMMLIPQSCGDKDAIDNSLPTAHNFDARAARRLVSSSFNKLSTRFAERSSSSHAQAKSGSAKKESGR